MSPWEVAVTEPETVRVSGPAGPVAPVEPEPARRTGVVTRVVAWLLLVVVAAALVVAAQASGRIWIVIAAAVGLVVAFLLTRFFRLVRRRPLIAFGLLLLVVVGVVGVGLVIYRNSDAPSNSAAPVPGLGPITVPYKATGRLNGDAITVREEIVIDATAIKTVNEMLPERANDENDLMRTPAGWTLGARVDNYPTFVRTRTFSAGENSLVSSSMEMPIDLGSLPIHDEDIKMYPRDGSQLELSATKGALGATYPDASKTANDPRPGGGEVTTIPVDRSVLDVSVAVLKGPLRNPIGQQVYEAFVWGPLPWAVGAFFALLASLAGDKLKQLLGLAARRVIRRGPVPQQS
jgi:hypothetical protein